MIENMINTIKGNPVEAIIMGLVIIFLILVLSLPIVILLMGIACACIILLIPTEDWE